MALENRCGIRRLTRRRNRWGCTACLRDSFIPECLAMRVLLVPEMYRTRGLWTPETTTPTTDGWRCVNDVLGGPGRNRTTDTRIFKTRLRRTRRQATWATS